MIKNTAMISVIVPIYNVEEYILKCLKSIQNQTYKNLEVILINDGSTDQSGSIAETFSQSDYRFNYINKTNGGLSSARNVGIEFSHGEFIYFIDSDDWIENNYLESLINAFDDETDIVIGKYTLNDPKSGKKYIPQVTEQLNISLEGEEKEREVIERHLNAYPRKGYRIKMTLMPVWKNMYRRTLITNYNLRFVNERIVGAEDYVFNFEAYYYAKKIRICSATGYIHNIVEGSLSRNFKLNQIDKDSKRLTYVKNAIYDKTFINLGNILEALKYEQIRSILGNVYSVSISNLKNKKELTKEFYLQTDVKRKLNNLITPNLERKYLIIYFLLKIFGITFSYYILNWVNVLYKKYKKSLLD